jgi:hypothetical protein
VALVQAEAARRALWPGRRGPLAAHAALLVLVLGHAAGEEQRDLDARPPQAVPDVVPHPGVPALIDPWSYALITGRPAVLAR